MPSDKKRMDCLESLRGEELEEFFLDTMFADITFREALDKKIEETKTGEGLK